MRNARYCRNTLCGEELAQTDRGRWHDPSDYCPSCRAAARFGFTQGAWLIGLIAAGLGALWQVLR